MLRLTLNPMHQLVRKLVGRFHSLFAGPRECTIVVCSGLDGLKGIQLEAEIIVVLLETEDEPDLLFGNVLQGDLSVNGWHNRRLSTFAPLWREAKAALTVESEWRTFARRENRSRRRPNL